MYTFEAGLRFVPESSSPTAMHKTLKQHVEQYLNTKGYRLLE